MFALAKVERLARKRGDTAIAERASIALEHDRETRKLDLRWAGERLSERSDGRVQAADVLLDQALAGLRNGARSVVQGAGPGDPLVALADEFLTRVFPAGLKVIVQQPYVEELASAEAIVELLRGEMATHVSRLGLDVHARRVIDRTDEYRAAQVAENDDLGFTAVREAREVGHELLASVVALVLATYYLPRDPDHARARAELLAPILEQDAIVRAMRRARRRVTDVDPDTGEPDESIPVDMDAGLDEPDEASDVDEDQASLDQGAGQAG